MSPKAHWRACYRAARMAVAHRADLAYDHCAGDWTKTPRAPASESIRLAIEAIQGADYQGDLMRKGSRRWMIPTLAENALRPVQPMREALQVNVLNGFGMFSGYRAPAGNYYENWPNNRICRWMALDQRRRDLHRRLKARGVFTFDQGNHVRHVDFSKAA